MKRRTIRILCLQETRWKGCKAIEIGDGIKLFNHGVETKKNGVAIAVDTSLKDHISSVIRVSNRITSLRIATAKGFWTVVSVYAPQSGCTEMEKATFYEELDDVIRSVPKSDYLTIGGDFNGHVGQDRRGFERMHGGRGFGSRNQDGERIMEVAEAHDLTIKSTFFTKRESQKVTYSSGGRKSETDHVLVQKWQLALANSGLKLNTKKNVVSSIEEDGHVFDANETAFTQAKEFKYLGSVLSADGTIDIDGSECLPLSRAHERMLNTVEMRMLRWACGLTRRDKVPYDDIRTIMQTAPIQLKLRAQRLRWYGHVMRRPSQYPTRQAMEMDVAGKRPLGAPKKRWKDAIRKDMEEVGVTNDDTRDLQLTTGIYYHTTNK
ncbi:hypothetical protein ANCCEY_06449 [Ancylostoma ceylanicum]|uniref:Endonuclease/exonuclease/phosphatase domain-containing protein n=1 Tax=Ancylostoma ceylanicum TaxID=53326 RepID=A0A0D6LRE6_9BILA|nr:hypothetical protein ANCCEY_06449 [Ancylostoma ceylanicum]